MEWALLVIGGFCLGIVAFVGQRLALTAPKEHNALLTIVIGVAFVIVIDVWAVFYRDTSAWWEVCTLIGFLLISLGTLWLYKNRPGRVQ